MGVPVTCNPPTTDGFKRVLMSKLSPKRSFNEAEYVTGEGELNFFSVILTVCVTHVEKCCKAGINLSILTRTSSTLVKPNTKSVKKAFFYLSITFFLPYSI